jgi:hypothetical protein
MNEDNGREITIRMVRGGEVTDLFHCKDSVMAVTVARGILARMQDLQAGDVLIATWREPDLISRGLG